MGYDAAKDYIFLITTGGSGWIVIWESSQELLSLYIFLTCKNEQPATRQRNEIKNSETKMCMWK